MAKLEKVCQYCNRTFLADSWEAGERKYCSERCYRLSRRRRVEVECQYCHKRFWVWESDASKRKYCSKRCYSLSQRGKLITLELREKLRKSSLGRHLSEEAKRKISLANKGSKSFFYGKHLSEETKRKISKSQKGEKAPNWKGGVSPENEIIWSSFEMKKWREDVFTRDNYTCQRCGRKGGELHAHHIFNFSIHPELRFEVNNGITLCSDCHKTFHKIFGMLNNSREQLTKFLNNIT